MTVVKVQVPLFSSDPSMQTSSRGLVYDERRRHMGEQALPPDVIEALGKDVKGFFQAEWNGKTWEIGKRVPGRGW